MDKKPAWLLLAALPVLFVALGGSSIWDANEAFYVETPRQMVLTGDYVSPTFNAAPRHNKPVLSYWIVAGLYQLFGISVGVERLGIALGALGIVGVTFMLGRAIGPTGATAWWAALIVLTAPRFVMFSRRIFIDIYITLFMAAALACLAQAIRRPGRRGTWLILMWISLGLGALTKGPVALVLPAAVCVAWLAWDRRLAEIASLRLGAGLAIVLGILAPWGVAMYSVHGIEPLATFIGADNIGRFAESMVPDVRPWWFYGPVLLSDLFPWAPLVLLPLVTAWRPNGPLEDDADARIRRLCWWWVVVIVAAFSLSATKQDLYIFPAMPAVAVLIAHAFTGPSAALRATAIRSGVVVVSLLTAAGGVGIVWLFSDGFYAVRSATLAGGLLVAGGLAAAATHWSSSWHRGARVLAATFVAFNYVLVARMLPGAERFKPIPPIAAAFTRDSTPGARLGAWGTMLPSLVYYAGRSVTELPDLDSAVAFVSDPGQAWLLVERAEWDALRARVPGLCVAEARHLFALDQKLSAIAREIPPPEIFLIRNRCG